MSLIKFYWFRLICNLLPRKWVRSCEVLKKYLPNDKDLKSLIYCLGIKWLFLSVVKAAQGTVGLAGMLGLVARDFKSMCV